MERVLFLMEKYMKESGQMINQKDKEYYIIKMVKNNMKEVSNLVTLKAKEYCLIKKGKKYIKGHLLIICIMT